MVGSPTPRIRRDPRIARALVVRIGAVRVRIPRRAGKVGTPHRAPAAAIHEAPVVGHVVQAVRIGRPIEGAHIRRPRMVSRRGLVPLIVGLGQNVLGHRRLLMLQQVEGDRLLLVRIQGRARRVGNVQVAVQHRQLRLGPIQLQPDVAGRWEGEVLVPEGQIELVIARLHQADVGHALHQVDWSRQCRLLPSAPVAGTPRSSRAPPAGCCCLQIRSRPRLRRSSACCFPQSADW